MDDVLAKQIGIAVRARRRDLGLSQEVIAERVGIAPQFLGRIERGLTFPSIPTLMGLSRALAMPPGSILPGAHQEQAPLDSNAATVPGETRASRWRRQNLPERLNEAPPELVDAIWQVFDALDSNVTGRSARRR
jgi:transcriptional regulator with XRE-family HTH domain